MIAKLRQFISALTILNYTELVLCIALLLTLLLGYIDKSIEFLWMIVVFYGILVLKYKQFGGMVVGGGFNIHCQHPQAQPQQPQASMPVEDQQDKKPIKLKVVEGDGKDGEEK